MLSASEIEKRKKALTFKLYEDLLEENIIMMEVIQTIALETHGKSFKIAMAGLEFLNKLSEKRKEKANDKKE